MEGIELRKCGLTFEPLALVLLYRSEEGESRKRTILVRNLTSTSSITQVSGDLRKDSKNGPFLRLISEAQMARLLTILRDHLAGISLQDSLENNKKVENIDSNEDLNLVDDETLKRKKAVMEETFQKNQKKPGDNDFEYEVEVNFENQEIEAGGWDSDMSDF